MRIRYSVLVLSLLFIANTFNCEAAKLTKAQMEELYNNGGTVSTKPSSAQTKVISTKPASSAEKPKVEMRESSKPILKSNVPVAKQAHTTETKVSVKESVPRISNAKEHAVDNNSIEVPKTESTKQQKLKPSKTKKEKSKMSKEEKKINSSSWRIKVAQKNLRTLGFSKEASTGKLTTTTKEAILAFQKKYKLDANGELNNSTYTKLNWEAFAKTGIKNIKGSDVVAKAAKYKGVPYVFGGTTPKGFDCSGYVQYVFKQLGGTLTRTADTQAEEGIFITQKQLKPGDLVFFTTYEPGASHVGIYAGNDKFWNASSSRGVVLYGLNDDYWRVRYYGARRVLVSNGEIK